MRSSCTKRRCWGISKLVTMIEHILLGDRCTETIMTTIYPVEKERSSSKLRMEYELSQRPWQPYRDKISPVKLSRELWRLSIEHYSQAITNEYGDQYNVPSTETPPSFRAVQRTLLTQWNIYLVLINVRDDVQWHLDITLWIVVYLQLSGCTICCGLWIIGTGFMRDILSWLLLRH